MSTPITPSNAPRGAIDRDRLLALFGGSAERLRHITNGFIQESDCLATEIREALEQEDGPRLVEAVSALKGSVGDLAGDAALDATLHLEELARASEFAQARNACERVKRELVEMRSVLRQMTGGA